MYQPLVSKEKAWFRERKRRDEKSSKALMIDAVATSSNTDVPPAVRARRLEPCARIVKDFATSAREHPPELVDDVVEAVESTLASFRFAQENHPGVIGDPRI